MGIRSGVVMHIDAGKHAPLPHFLMDCLRHARLSAGQMFGSRPDAVEIRLLVQSAQTLTRGQNVAEEYGDRPRQDFFGIFLEQGLYGFQSGRFVPMQQHGHEQRLRLAPGQMDQRGHGNQLVKLFGASVE